MRGVAEAAGCVFEDRSLAGNDLVDLGGDGVASHPSCVGEPPAYDRAVACGVGNDLFHDVVGYPGLGGGRQ